MQIERVLDGNEHGFILDGARPPIDGNGDQRLGPAITWEDDRADGDGERFREAAGADALYASTGQWVDGRYLLPPCTLGYGNSPPARK